MDGLRETENSAETPKDRVLAYLRKIEQGLSDEVIEQKAALGQFAYGMSKDQADFFRQDLRLRRESAVSIVALLEDPQKFQENSVPLLLAHGFLFDEERRIAQYAYGEGFRTGRIVPSPLAADLKFVRESVVDPLFPSDYAHILARSRDMDISYFFRDL